MTLEQLSAAATEGEWISIQSSINPDRHYITNEHNAIFASEIGGTKPADLKFVTSLVNLYRTGQLVAVTDDAIERVKAENEALRIALHDAIRRPMGVVPASADPFYSPAMADEAEAIRALKSPKPPIL